jgi:hypothetical protein
MRFRNAVFALLACSCVATLFFGTAEAQAPQAQPPNGAAASLAPANVTQVMRGILFPNSNLVFFAQDQNPAAVKSASFPSASTDPLTGPFAGWEAVENGALALVESANLLTIPGRVCSNGQAVPVQNADWAKFVQQLRDAGMIAYKAAQTKDQKNMLEAADTVNLSCTNCHARYRRGRAGSASNHCM